MKLLNDLDKVDEFNEHYIEIFETTEYSAQAPLVDEAFFQFHLVVYTFLGCIPKAEVCWTSVEPQEQTPDLRPIDASHCLHMLDPSVNEPVHCWGYALMQSAFAPLLHHAHYQGTVRTLWPFLHLRQPYESWLSIHHVICRWTVDRFF